MSAAMNVKKPKSPAAAPLAPALIGHKLLSDRHVEEMTSLSRRHRQQLEAAGKFPLPIRLSAKLRLYPAREVLSWIAAREAARREAARREQWARKKPLSEDESDSGQYASQTQKESTQ